MHARSSGGGECVCVCVWGGVELTHTHTHTQTHTSQLVVWCVILSCSLPLPLVSLPTEHPAGPEADVGDGRKSRRLSESSEGLRRRHLGPLWQPAVSVSLVFKGKAVEATLNQPSSLDITAAAYLTPDCEQLDWKWQLLMTEYFPQNDSLTF